MDTTCPKCSETVADVVVRPSGKLVWSCEGCGTRWRVQCPECDGKLEPIGQVSRCEDCGQEVKAIDGALALGEKVPKQGWVDDTGVRSRTTERTKEARSFREPATQQTVREVEWKRWVTATSSVPAMMVLLGATLLVSAGLAHVGNMPTTAAVFAIWGLGSLAAAAIAAFLRANALRSVLMRLEVRPHEVELHTDDEVRTIPRVRIADVELLQQPEEPARAVLMLDDGEQIVLQEEPTLEELRPLRERLQKELDL